MSTYLQLSNNALVAERSILHSPPTNAFYGVYSAIRQRHLFFGVLSAVTIIAELGLPVTLSHVPFSKTETYMTQFVCAWLSIAILGMMILTLAASFSIKWPHLPVDPRTIAGAMYYVRDSGMLETMEGMSTLQKKHRDRRIKRMGRRYGFGYVKGLTGRGRVGVDFVDDREEARALVASYRQ